MNANKMDSIRESTVYMNYVIKARELCSYCTASDVAVSDGAILACRVDSPYRCITL